MLEGINNLDGVVPLPDGFSRLALVLLVIGLPIVLATAFVQEGVSGGDWDDAGPADAPGEARHRGTSRLFTWRNAILGGAGAFTLLLGVGVGWMLFAEPTTSIYPSVAVMPCTDGGAAGDQTALTQGFAEGIISALTRLPNLKVIALHSVIELLERGADLETIAETLDVATVLQCDLRQVGETICVTPMLIEAATSVVLWGEPITGPADSIFEIQDSAARAVTEALQITTAAGEDTPLVARGTTVPEAAEAYRRGRLYLRARREQSIRDAISEFQNAIALDETYAEAHAGLAESYLVLDYYIIAVEDQDFETHVARGLAYARTAIRYADDLGEAHAALAWGLFGNGEWESAETAFELAIDMNPGYATAHQWFGNFMRHTGRAADGVAHAERAVDLDPVSPIVHVELARALANAG